jgi:hypothetical protein
VDDAIQKFLEAKTFQCPHLKSRLTKESCVARQNRELNVTYFGRRVNLSNTPSDKWCRSGECQLGTCIKKYLHSKSKSPCKVEIKRAAKAVAAR